jgi:TetR/AcrR family transcriptional repressor of bet genes
MPQSADSEDRRAQIIEALWRVTMTRGLSGASFRTVAAEAGVSVNLVQYYFGTKAQLLTAAVVRLGEQIVGRGLALIAAAGPDPSTRSLVRAVVLGALPTDDQSRTAMVLFFTFYIAGLTDPSLASAETLAAPASVVPVFVDLVRRGQQRGEIPEHFDPDVEAGLLVAMMTGLWLGVIAGMSDSTQATELIDSALDKLFSPQQDPSQTTRQPSVRQRRRKK